MFELYFPLGGVYNCLLFLGASSFCFLAGGAALLVLPFPNVMGVCLLFPVVTFSS